MAAAERGAATEEQRLQPPSLFLMLAEARSLFELNSSLLLSPLLLRAPKGDGHPVLALPGFLASDLSMAPMRRYLTELGYDTHAWTMGRNLGGVASKRAALRDLLRRIHESSGRKVSLVGWSLGGVYARDLALQMSDMVRSVITLGSPFANDIRATAVSATMSSTVNADDSTAAVQVASPIVRNRTVASNGTSPSSMRTWRLTAISIPSRSNTSRWWA